jgi:hypothetical protein
LYAAIIGLISPGSCLAIAVLCHNWVLIRGLPANA